MNEFTWTAGRHLAELEQLLLELQAVDESVAGYLDHELLNTVVSDVRAVQQLAAPLELQNIDRLAGGIQQTCRRLPAATTGQRAVIVEVLLRATDMLALLVLNAEHSDSLNVELHLRALAGAAAPSDEPEDERGPVDHPPAARDPIALTEQTETGRYQIRLGWLGG